MIYRRNILLAIVEVFGGELNATDFQKLLFLFSENQQERKFDFVPYKFGCFSFQSMADKNKLIMEGLLENTNSWKLTSPNNHFQSKLNVSDKLVLTKIKARFANFSTNELIKYVYTNYPYYAIKSEIASRTLSSKELMEVKRLKPRVNEHGLFTLGYEGRSLEAYLNILIQQNIKVLCDVRKNPLSRKYGFAKRTLQNSCESLDIKYLHLPELGIVSAKRKNLNNQDDYDQLFYEYEKTIIPEQMDTISFIYKLIRDEKRVALTCYEASPNQCHRTRVANAVNSIDNDIQLTHL